jgi:sec-independent protein translocase protein TatB
MFNFGWGELVLIGIVALIAIGPKELPTVLRSVGQMLGKVRRMANEFQGQFQEALREAEIADLKKHADEVTSSLNTTMSDISQYDPLADTQKELEKNLSLDEPASPAAATAPAELPPIDVPLPDLPAPVTEKDFAVVTPDVKSDAKQDAKQDAKPAEGGAPGQSGGQGVKA